MATDSLGRLEIVDPREIWKDEARDFTPWLLENADLLADALGIDLELEEAEHPVGGFSLDLLGRDLTNEVVLIVENQLGPSDHTHLGQILTYAAGTDASTIVWVATEFRPEHRQAIDWFNERTGEEARLFGVQVGVRRIENSPPAPLFDVVAKPNDWQKQVRAAVRASQQTGKGRLYLEFWEKYVKRLRETHPDWSRAKPRTYNYFNSTTSIRGATLNPTFSDGGRIAHVLWIDSGDAEGNRAFFQALFDQREIIEATYGGPLEWDLREDRRACKVIDFSAGRVEEEDRHDEFIGWFIDTGERFRRALSEADIPSSVAT